MALLYKLVGLGMTQTLLTDGPVMVLSLGEIRPPVILLLSREAELNMLNHFRNSIGLIHIFNHMIIHVFYHMIIHIFYISSITTTSIMPSSTHYRCRYCTQIFAHLGNRDSHLQ